ncbi:hypothetical protein MCOR03_007376 [Pyricularia oryzae]|nr:hypothetical protein MCOR03_007376 [Pyricularia oryzae]
MAQPQHQIQLPPAPQRPFSPAQLSPSTIPHAHTQATYPAGNPPNKKQRMSPAPPQSQPASPYVPSPVYASSPAASATPPPQPNAASPPPMNPQIALPQATTMAPPPQAITIPQQPTPYVNGNTINSPGIKPTQQPMGLTMPGLTMPSRQPGTPLVASPAPLITTTATTPLTPAPVSSPYATATLAPMPSHPATPGGTMGPPSKPADRPQKEVEYDVNDSLNGTGIDLKEMEQDLVQFYAGSTRAEARTGFPANVPGSSASMYGAGLANQPAQLVGMADQAQFAAELAKGVWSEAAAKLATVRSQEVKNPFSNIAVIHSKASKIAKEYGIGLVLDPKTNGGMGKMKLDTEFAEPSVTVTQKVIDNEVVVNTSKSFLPADSFLAEQIGLLSIATKHRIRQLLEDADRVARTRQQTSHGIVPSDWMDVSAPITTVDASLTDQANSVNGDGSAASPRTNPLKRPLGAGVSQVAASLGLSAVMREQSKNERNAEEARLLKRQKRAEEEDGKKKGGDSANPSRAGSVAPGTPGASSIAPETPKLTKKEERARAAQNKTMDWMNTASANSTTSHFLGQLSRKKKGKKYDWLTSGGSGASTPSRAGPGTPAAGAGAAPSRKAPESIALTVDGRYRLGSLRENSDKGKNIQLRDWITVLESDRLEIKALQTAYDKLDASAAT